MLDKSTGSVLQRSGTVRSSFTDNTLSQDSKDGLENISPSHKDADEFSTMIWSFVKAAGGLVSNFDSEVLMIEVENHKKGKLTCE